MHPVIEQQLPAIAALCGRYRVRRLALFGSAGEDRPEASARDIDLLVDFRPLGPGEHADAYFGLKESLEQLFRRPVDLVMESAVTNPYFLDEVRRTERELYAA